MPQSFLWGDLPGFGRCEDDAAALLVFGKSRSGGVALFDEAAFGG